MKTIEERAKEYAQNIYGGSFGIEIAFIRGARSEHEELTRWHDPKEELPTVINTDEDYPLLIKDVRGKVWSGLYRAYNNTFWYDGITGRFHADVSGMQGWREIHE